MRFIPLALILAACSTSSPPTVPGDLPYEVMASRITASLQSTAGEQILIRFDPEVLPGFSPVLEQDLASGGAQVTSLPYGSVDELGERLDQTDVYIWLPTNDPQPHSAEDTATLGRWLDSGRGRQIHFHWGGGTMGTDGIAGEHSAAYDVVYIDALSIDYGELNRQQDSAIALLRSGPVRVTTPAGTDIRFLLGDRSRMIKRPFNKQNGNASPASMSSAQTRIDRETELPAGVIRVAPMEETVFGTVVVPWARFGDVEVRGLRLEFERGQVPSLSAREGEDAVRAALEASPALNFFREFCLGFNPKLVVPMGSRWLPYYGYGAGVVRLSLGNNFEVGGLVSGVGTRWFFFPDATVEIGATALVVGGELVAPPSSLDTGVLDALNDLRPRVTEFLRPEFETPDAKGRVAWVYGDVVAIQLLPDSPAIEDLHALFAIYSGDTYKGDAVVAAVRDRLLLCLMGTVVDNVTVSTGDNAAVRLGDR